LEEDEVITKPKRSKLRIMMLTISLVLLVLIGAGVGTALYAANALQPVPPSDQEVRVNVPPGTGTVQIANLLKEQGLIKSPFIFAAYLKWKNQGSHFQAGEYAMKPGMTLDQMIDQMNNGQSQKS
jgi:UPF0755 protein